MQFYVKPKDMKYTDMCIWIDNNAYTDGCDDDKLFEYLYHITRMLAYKKRYFEKAEYYDDFAIFMSTKLFMRYKNPKQFREDKNTALPKVKSILNYAKNTLYACKVAFENEDYAQNYTRMNECGLYDSEFSESLINMADKLKIVDFCACLDSIPNMIKYFVERLPYRSEVELTSIYTSCLLSLLSSIVLNYRNNSRLNNLMREDKLSGVKLNNIYKKERDNCIILYHLPVSMKPYIYVIVNEIRHEIASNLSVILNSSMHTDNSVRSMMFSTLRSDLTYNQEEEE